MDNHRLIILYGSQTGTAQDIAEMLWRDSKKYNFTGPVLSLSDYNIKSLLLEDIAIFVCSTTGQGDEPDNMREFWKFLLRKDLPRDSLKHLDFAVLGLGDSSYQKFNFVAKRLYRRLIQLSAHPIMPLGLCDDQHDLGLAAEYFKWSKELWDNLESKCNLIKDENAVTQYKFKAYEAQEKAPHVEIMDFPLGNTLISSQAEVTENNRTTACDHFQDVRLISFSHNLTWLPGDVLVIRPWNSEEDVDFLFNIFQEYGLKFTRETTVEFKQIFDEMPLPAWYQKPISLETAAKYIWDLKAIPRQRVFELLALNCEDELEKEKLIEFTTAEGLDDYFNYATRPRRTILEVLYDFSHAVSKLTIPVLFEMFQVIQPRSFSIASIPQFGSLQVLVAVVEYKTKLSKPRKGLCSNWLKDLKIGQKVFVSIKKGTLKIPQDKNIPIVMVGPGTGVAPFRSLIMERALSNSLRSHWHLFFGCRNKMKDFHFQNDFEKWEKENVVQCFYAFSRDQDEKRYVQHVIEEQGDKFKTILLEQNGIILVAGSSKNMPNDVRNAFAKILGDNEIINKLIKENRYQEETWS